MYQTHQTRQQGFSLFIVMIIMLVIAMLVVVTNQSASTESRISANDADRKYALTMAEGGLREAENVIQAFLAAKPGSVIFSYDCNNGLCAPVEEVNMVTSPTSAKKPLFTISGSKNNDVAWKRVFNKKTIWEHNDRTLDGRNGNTRYIIEFLGERQATDGLRYNFRVTARANGQNPNTVVMLQSIVELAP
ncbi:MAG: PilX N-terminal domain-containing pilus assembly protein [Conchiformibius sp.]|nr:PilX N-terminal domain-containing pilus assembly protein [Conchiformibius sp.]